MADPRYPIGRFVPDPNPTPETRARHMEAIAGLPSRLSPILFQVGTASLLRNYDLASANASS
jgi:hypothetical protein